MCAPITHTPSAGGELWVWLDDDFEDRVPPAGWTHVATVAEVCDLLDSGRVTRLSLDNDLGDRDTREGKHVIDHLCEQQILHGRLLWPEEIILHTANSSARDQMSRGIERYAQQHYQLTRTMTAGGKPRFLLTVRR